MKTLLLSISIAIANCVSAQSVAMYNYDMTTQQNLDTIRSGDTLVISTYDNVPVHIEFDNNSISDINFRILNISGCAGDPFVSGPIPDPDFQQIGCIISNANFLSPVHQNIDLGNTSFLIYEDISGCQTNMHHRYIIRIDGIEVDSFDLVVNNDLAVEEKESILAFEVFPNPCTGIVHINISDHSSLSSYQISNCFGQVIIEEELVGSSGTIDLQNCENGIYFITLSDIKGNKRTKSLMINP